MIYSIISLIIAITTLGGAIYLVKEKEISLLEITLFICSAYFFSITIGQFIWQIDVKNLFVYGLCVSSCILFFFQIAAA